MLPKTDRILNFSEESAKHKKKEGYGVPKEDLWPNRARRTPLIRSPALVLDMPSLQTELSK